MVIGVGKAGKDIVMQGDFTVHIPYGCAYMEGEIPGTSDTGLQIIRFQTIPPNYRDGEFEINEKLAYDGRMSIKLLGHLEGVEDTLKDFPLSTILKDRAYNVGVDTPHIKSAYFPMDVLGTVGYGFVIYTLRNVYTGGINFVLSEKNM